MSVISFVISICVFYGTVYYCYTLFGYLPRHLSDFGNRGEVTMTFFNAALGLAGYALVFLSFYMTPALWLRAAASPDASPRHRFGLKLEAAVIPFLGLGVAGAGALTSDDLKSHVRSLMVSIIIWFVLLVTNFCLAGSRKWRAAHAAHFCLILVYALNKPDAATHEMMLPLLFSLLFGLVYFNFLYPARAGQRASDSYSAIAGKTEIGTGQLV
jgi:hypothetical protein